MGGNSFSFLLQSKRTRSIVAEWKEASFWFCLETNVETLNERKDILSIMEWVRLTTFCERSPVELYLFYMSLSCIICFPSIPPRSISSYSHFANQNFSSKSFRFGYLPIKITKANLSLIPDLIKQAKYTIWVPFFVETRKHYADLTYYSSSSIFRECALSHQVISDSKAIFFFFFG